MKQLAQTSAPHLTLLPRAAWQHLCWLAMRLRAWKLRQEASRRLLELSDAHLKDIGLHRSEVVSKLIELDARRWRRPDTSGSPETE